MVRGKLNTLPESINRCSEATENRANGAPYAVFQIDCAKIIEGGISLVCTGNLTDQDKDRLSKTPPFTVKVTYGYNHVAIKLTENPDYNGPPILGWYNYPFDRTTQVNLFLFDLDGNYTIECERHKNRLRYVYEDNDKNEFIRDFKTLISVVFQSGTSTGLQPTAPAPQKKVSPTSTGPQKTDQAPQKKVSPTSTGPQKTDQAPQNEVPPTPDEPQQTALAPQESKEDIPMEERFNSMNLNDSSDDLAPPNSGNDAP